MAGEQAFSPSKSMVEKKDQRPQHFDEAWFEFANPHGKEFDLPELSNSLSLDASEKNADLGDFASGLVDVPIGIDNTILRATIHRSGGGNPTESLHSLEVHEDLAKENNLFEVPIFDGISFHLNPDEFLAGEKPEFSNTFDLRSSFALPYPQANPTDIHISADDAQSKGILASSNESFSVSNDFTFDTPAFSSSPRNEVACDPITNTTYVGPLGLKNSALTMEIPTIVPTPKLTQAQSSPLTNSFGTGGEGQAFGLHPFQVGHQSSSHLSGENGISIQDQGNSGSGQGYLIVEGNSFSIQEKGKEKVSIPPALGDEGLITGQCPLSELENEFSGRCRKGEEKIQIPLEEMELGQASKRLKQDDLVEENSNGFWGEAFSASPSALLQDVVITASVGGGIEDIIPSPGMHPPGQLVFKEVSDSKKPGN